MDKKWMTLNAHGKGCLIQFLLCISGTDIRDTQIDYLMNKELIDTKLNYKTDWKDREDIAGYCLTDLGMHTARHYFPGFTYWDKKPFFTSAIN